MNIITYIIYISHHVSSPNLTPCELRWTPNFWPHMVDDIISSVQKLAAWEDKQVTSLLKRRMVHWWSCISPYVEHLLPQQTHTKDTSGAVLQIYWRSLFGQSALQAPLELAFMMTNANTTPPGLQFLKGPWFGYLMLFTGSFLKWIQRWWTGIIILQSANVNYNSSFWNRMKQVTVTSMGFERASVFHHSMGVLGGE